MPIDWSAVTPPRPTFLGPRTFADYPLAELVDFIDWTPFFTTWEMRGAYPAILDDPRLGAAARDLHRDALALLDRLVADGRLTANAVVGFWPANSDGDDIAVWCDDERQEPRATFRTLRQQMAKPDGRPNVALADFVAPVEIGRRRLHRRLRGHDRASGSTRSSPSSRRPTTTTRRSSPRPSPTAWPRPSPSGSTSASGASCGATRPTRRSTNTDLIAERYQGIRPAPGYPACPDHTEKATLFDLLEAESRAGIRLTESFAMWPGAAVSGYYLWNPDSHYFGVGRIGRDQLADYAARKGVPLAEAERWLAPNLVDEEAGGVSRDELLEAFRDFPPTFAAAATAVEGEPVPAGEWGPAEIARHLIAVEREVWWTRFASIVDEEEPHWSWLEPGLEPGLDDVPLAEILARHAAARAHSVAIIDGFTDAQWDRSGVHATYGRLDVAALLGIVTDHDREHLASLDPTTGREPAVDRQADEPTTSLDAIVVASASASSSASARPSSINRSAGSPSCVRATSTGSGMCRIWSTPFVTPVWSAICCAAPASRAPSSSRPVRRARWLVTASAATSLVRMPDVRRPDCLR